MLWDTVKIYLSWWYLIHLNFQSHVLFSLKFCYENMHVHVSLSSTFDIKISGWTKAIKSTEMNL